MSLIRVTAVAASLCKLSLREGQESREGRLGRGVHVVAAVLHFPACFSICANHTAIKQVSLPNATGGEAVLFKSLPNSPPIKLSFVAIPGMRYQVVNGAVNNSGISGSGKASGRIGPVNSPP